MSRLLVGIFDPSSSRRRNLRDALRPHGVHLVKLSSAEGGFVSQIVAANVEAVIVFVDVDRAKEQSVALTLLKDLRAERLGALPVFVSTAQPPTDGAMTMLYGAGLSDHFSCVAASGTVMADEAATIARRVTDAVFRARKARAVSDDVRSVNDVIRYTHQLHGDAAKVLKAEEDLVLRRIRTKEDRFASYDIVDGTLLRVPKRNVSRPQRTSAGLLVKKPREESGDAGARRVVTGTSPTGIVFSKALSVVKCLDVANALGAAASPIAAAALASTAALAGAVVHIVAGCAPPSPSAAPATLASRWQSVAAQSSTPRPDGGALPFHEVPPRRRHSSSGGTESDPISSPPTPSYHAMEATGYGEAPKREDSDDDDSRESGEDSDAESESRSDREEDEEGQGAADNGGAAAHGITVLATALKFSSKLRSAVRHRNPRPARLILGSPGAARKRSSFSDSRTMARMTSKARAERRATAAARLGRRPARAHDATSKGRDLLQIGCKDPAELIRIVVGSGAAGGSDKGDDREVTRSEETSVGPDRMSVTDALRGLGVSPFGFMATLSSTAAKDLHESTSKIMSGVRLRAEGGTTEMAAVMRAVFKLKRALRRRLAKKKGAHKLASSKRPPTLSDLSKGQRLLRAGFELRQCREYHAAIDMYTHALAVEPGLFLANLCRGVAYDKCGMLAEAAADFRAVLRHKPGHVLALFNLAVVQVQLGDDDGALRSLDASIRYDPADPDLYHNRALIYRRRGDFMRAKGDYARVYQLRGRTVQRGTSIGEMRPTRLRRALSEYYKRGTPLKADSVKASPVASAAAAAAADKRPTGGRSARAPPVLSPTAGVEISGASDDAAQYDSTSSDDGGDEDGARELAAPKSSPPSPSGDVASSISSRVSPVAADKRHRAAHVAPVDTGLEPGEASDDVSGTLGIALDTPLTPRAQEREPGGLVSMGAGRPRRRSLTEPKPFHELKEGEVPVLLSQVHDGESTPMQRMRRRSSISSVVTGEKAGAQVVHALFQEPSALQLALRAPAGSRSSAQVQVVSSMLAGLHFFRYFPPEVQNAVCEAVQYTAVDTGYVVCEQGAPANEFYIILSGSCAVRVWVATAGSQVTIGSMEAGASFGELGLIRGETRKVTVQAKEPTELLWLGGDDFVRLGLARFFKNQLRDRLQALKSTGLFDSEEWTDKALLDLAAIARPHMFDRGTVIVEQGKPPEALYILIKGICRVSKVVDAEAVLEKALKDVRLQLARVRMNDVYHHSLRPSVAGVMDGDVAEVARLAVEAERVTKLERERDSAFGETAPAPATKPLSRSSSFFARGGTLFGGKAVKQLLALPSDRRLSTASVVSERGGDAADDREASVALRGSRDVPGTGSGVATARTAGPRRLSRQDENLLAVEELRERLGTVSRLTTMERAEEIVDSALRATPKPRRRSGLPASGLPDPLQSPGPAAPEQDVTGPMRQLVPGSVPGGSAALSLEAVIGGARALLSRSRSSRQDTGGSKLRAHANMGSLDGAPASRPSTAPTRQTSPQSTYRGPASPVSPPRSPDALTGGRCVAAPGRPSSVRSRSSMRPGSAPPLNVVASDRRLAQERWAARQSAAASAAAAAAAAYATSSTRAGGNGDGDGSVPSVFEFMIPSASAQVAFLPRARASATVQELRTREESIRVRLRKLRIRRHWSLDRKPAERTPFVVCQVFPVGLFGESAVLDPWAGKNPATITAETHVEVLCINKKQIEMKNVTNEFLDTVRRHAVSLPSDAEIAGVMSHGRRWGRYKSDLVMSIPRSRWPAEAERVNLGTGTAGGARDT